MQNLLLYIIGVYLTSISMGIVLGAVIWIMMLIFKSRRGDAYAPFHGTTKN